MGMAAFHLALLTLVCLPHRVLGQHAGYDYGFNIAGHVKRQVAQPLVVRGEPDGTIQLRQEIRQLEQDEDMWTLYILGLSMLQFSDQSLPTSWYHLTGLFPPPLQDTLSYFWFDGMGR